MSYKIRLTVDVTLESKQAADRLAHLLMVNMENNAENYDGVLSAVAMRSPREELILNLPDSELEPGVIMGGDQWEKREQ